MRLNHVSRRVKDVARARAFYEGLGLAAIVQEHEPDGTLRYVRLVCPAGDGTFSLERAEEVAGDATELFFECDDLEATLATLRATHPELRAETKPWLWREAHLVDPDGHPLCLYQAGSYRLDPPWRLPGSPSPAPAPVPVAFRRHLARFTMPHNRGYAEASLPSARDHELARYLDELARAAPEEREAVADDLDHRTTRVFVTFAERAATLAVREREQAASWVLRGLLALAFTWRHAQDVRPGIPILGVLYDAAARAGRSPEGIFQEAAAVAPHDIAPLFEDFLSRPDLDTILDEMGFQAATDRDGFRYRRNWGGGKLEPDDEGEQGDDGDDGDDDG